MYKDYNIEKILSWLSLDKTRLQTHILNNAISNNEFYQKKNPFFRYNNLFFQGEIFRTTVAGYANGVKYL